MGQTFKGLWSPDRVMRGNYCCLLFIGVFNLVPVSSLALDQVQVLGVVEKLCAEEPYCLKLRVEAEYTTLTSQRISVRFAQVTSIFNPENYKLTLEQSNIVEGSHLRLLITPDAHRAKNDYKASYIWIGD